MTRFRIRLAGEEGCTLVLAVLMTAVLSVASASVMAYSTSGEASASRSKAEQTALTLAEAGLNDAYSTLYAASNPSLAAAVPTASAAMEGGTVSYSGTLSGSIWTLTGVGRVRNPTGAADVVRSVSGHAHLGTGTQGSPNNAVWNYVYADSLATCTTLSNSVNVNVPLYVRGNLCLQNSAQVSGYALQVGGSITLQNTSHVGSSTEPITEVHAGGGCSAGGPYDSPCGAADRVWGTTVDNHPTGLTKPPADLPGWYQDAAPGPLHACTSGSFPGGFDNDATLDHSRGEVDLAPAGGYDCRVTDAAGNLIGRLSWDPAAHRLTVAGTIFVDGDIVFRNLNTIVYEGRATVFASGTITIENQTTLCGVAGCGTGWDPLHNLLALVAGSSTEPVGFEIENNSTFQGAIYVVNDYVEVSSATVWGPIVARQLYLQNSTTNFYVPIGTLMPGMPASYDTVVVVVNDQGTWG